MEEVRRLAQTAAMIAAQLTTDEIESFRWRQTARPGVYEVALHLKEGHVREYTVLEWDRPSEGNPSLSP